MNSSHAPRAGQPEGGERRRRHRRIRLRGRLAHVLRDKTASRPWRGPRRPPSFGSASNCPRGRSRHSSTSAGGRSRSCPRSADAGRRQSGRGTGCATARGRPRAATIVRRKIGGEPASREGSGRVLSVPRGGRWHLWRCSVLLCYQYATIALGVRLLRGIFAVAFGVPLGGEALGA